MSRIHIARQPIFDAEDRLRGYELLYRGSAEATRAEGTPKNQMAEEVLLGTLTSFGLDRLTQGTRAFVNFSQSMLLDGSCALLPAHQVVIEILECVEPDREVLEACTYWAQQGYCFALDDFQYRPEAERLLHLASIVKLDVLECSDEEVCRRAWELTGFDVELLAERVESVEMKQQCLRAGYTLFQGYLYAPPETLSELTIPLSSEQAQKPE